MIGKVTIALAIAFLLAALTALVMVVIGGGGSMQWVAMLVMGVSGTLLSLLVITRGAP